MAQREDGFGLDLRDRPRHSMRCARPFEQTLRPVRLIAQQPLVAGLAVIPKLSHNSVMLCSASISAATSRTFSSIGQTSRHGILHLLP